MLETMTGVGGAGSSAVWSDAGSSAGDSAGSNDGFAGSGTGGS